MSDQPAPRRWHDIIVPSRLEPDDLWQRNGEYVSRYEADEKLNVFEAERNRYLEAANLRLTALLKMQTERDALRETLVQIRIAHSKHHSLTVDALLTAALDAAQKAHEPA